MQKVINNKIIRYILSGAIVSLFVFTVLFVLVNILNVWYLIASVTSFCLGLVLSFVLQKFFTFKDSERRGMNRQFSFFLIFNVCMLCVNTILMYVFVDIFGFWYLSSQVCVTMFTAFVNYSIFNSFLFKAR
jgi:putative flippase GtrA